MFGFIHLGAQNPRFFSLIEWIISFKSYSYGYSKERFVWSLISAVGIFCLGSGATIVHGFQNLWTTQVTCCRTIQDLPTILNPLSFYIISIIFFILLLFFLSIMSVAAISLLNLFTCLPAPWKYSVCSSCDWWFLYYWRYKLSYSNV